MTRAERPGPSGLRDTVRALRGLTSDPPPTLDRLVAEHGPTFVVGGGPLTMVVVGDPVHLGELLTTSVDAFKWGHRFNVLEFVVGPGSMIVSDNDEWRRRRSAAQPGFARRRLDGWIPLIVRETDRMIDALPAPAFDVYPHGRALVRRIVIRALFGESDLRLTRPLALLPFFGMEGGPVQREARITLEIGALARAGHGAELQLAVDELALRA